MSLQQRDRTVALKDLTLLYLVNNILCNFLICVLCLNVLWLCCGVPLSLSSFGCGVECALC